MDSHTIVQSPAFYSAFIRHLEYLRREFVRQGIADKASETLHLIREMQRLLAAAEDRTVSP